MILPETEAKTKWCPFARVMLYQPEAEHNPAVNRDTSNANCIASGCMAWKQEIQSVDDPKSFGYTIEPTGRGWCGLATAGHP